ncbi:MAG: hypothetical protein H6629_14675 [Calditrichae bacterium]|nr:hypothetical protein [Calditrichia bacterium]
MKTNGSSSVGAGMLNEDPLYLDPANNDYTLDDNSPLIGMADDGKSMGDRRWDPTINDPVVHKIPAATAPFRLQSMGLPMAISLN